MVSAAQRALQAYSERELDADALIREHSGLIDRTARSIAAKTGLWSAVDDLWSAGAMGLLEAATRFKPGHGVRLTTFLSHRVRGAMLDEVRKLDHLPRRLRTKTRAVSRATEELRSDLGRRPTDDEVATEADLSIEEVRSAQSLAEPVLSLDALAMPEARGEGPSPDSELDRRERVAALARAIGTLNERLQLVIDLRYNHGLTCVEIAEILEVSGPRVAQLHGQAIKKLKTALDADGIA